ncbi:flagellar hook-length control protein FliK [Balneatrix alpica]|uniref:flagellar hook-length control protein FliK n=1 Tax=Balneatrix alpica TaxID=75684 RepID=UPI002739A3F1|nr:flagellar hook-length control protein FliK [Balneatrix alpica]
MNAVSSVSTTLAALGTSTSGGQTEGGDTALAQFAAILNSQLGKTPTGTTQSLPTNPLNEQVDVGEEQLSSWLSMLGFPVLDMMLNSGAAESGNSLPGMPADTLQNVAALLQPNASDQELAQMVAQFEAELAAEPELLQQLLAQLVEQGGEQQEAVAGALTQSQKAGELTAQAVAAGLLGGSAVTAKEPLRTQPPAELAVSPLASAVAGQVAVGEVQTQTAASTLNTNQTMNANPLATSATASLNNLTPIAEVDQSGVPQTEMLLDGQDELLGRSAQAAQSTQSAVATATTEMGRADMTANTAATAVLAAKAEVTQHASVTAQAASQTPQQAVLHGLPASQAWGDQLQERVAWMSKNGLQQAEIQLDPPELGSLQIRIQIHNDQASIIFQSPSAQVREALEQHMLRLREGLQGQGVDLGSVDVRDHSQRGQGQSGREQSSFSGNAVADAEDTLGVTPVSSQAVSSGSGLVDYYA